MNRQTDRRMTGGWVDGWMDRQMDGWWVGGWMDGRVNGCMDEWVE